MSSHNKHHNQHPASNGTSPPPPVYLGIGSYPPPPPQYGSYLPQSAASSSTTPTVPTPPSICLQKSRPGSSTSTPSHRPSPKTTHVNPNNLLPQTKFHGGGLPGPLTLPRASSNSGYSSASSSAGAVNATTTTTTHTKPSRKRNSAKDAATNRTANGSREKPSPPPPESHREAESSGDGTGGTERDPHRIQQRQKQILFGKVTDGYREYVLCIPHKLRDAKNPRHPVTPRIDQAMSKRAWDSHVATWRRSLHEWDSGPKDSDTAYVNDIISNPAQQVQTTCDPGVNSFGGPSSSPWTQSRLDAYRAGIEQDLQKLKETVRSQYPPGTPPPSDAERSPAMEPAKRTMPPDEAYERIPPPQRADPVHCSPEAEGDVSDAPASPQRSGKKKDRTGRVAGRSVSQSPRSHSRHSPVGDTGPLIITIIQQQRSEAAADRVQKEAAEKMPPLDVECDIALDCSATASFELIMDSLRRTGLDVARLTFHDPQLLPSAEGLHGVPTATERSSSVGSTDSTQDPLCETRQCSLHPAGSLCKIYTLSTKPNQRLFAAKCLSSVKVNAPRLQLFSPDCSPLFSLPSGRSRDSAMIEMELVRALSNNTPNNNSGFAKASSPSPLDAQGLVFATSGFDLMLPPSLRSAHGSNSREATPMLFGVRPTTSGGAPTESPSRL